MEFSCPSCGMQLKAEAEHAGKQVRCPGCSTKLQIPAESAETQADAGAQPKFKIPAPNLTSAGARAVRGCPPTLKPRGRRDDSATRRAGLARGTAGWRGQRGPERGQCAG